MPPWATFFCFAFLWDTHTHTHTFTCQFNFLIKHAFNFKSARRGHAQRPAHPALLLLLLPLLNRSAPTFNSWVYSHFSPFASRFSFLGFRQQPGVRQKLISEALSSAFSFVPPLALSSGAPSLLRKGFEFVSCCCRLLIDILILFFRNFSIYFAHLLELRFLSFGFWHFFLLSLSVRFSHLVLWFSCQGCWRWCGWATLGSDTWLYIWHVAFCSFAFASFSLRASHPQSLSISLIFSKEIYVCICMPVYPCFWALCY